MYSKFQIINSKVVNGFLQKEAVIRTLFLENSGVFVGEETNANPSKHTNW